MRQITSAAFVWRDMRGNPHVPAKMATRHLWFTIRMIWNHTMPNHVRITPYHAYEFSADYTAAYLRDAVFTLGAELLSRDDIDPRWYDDLERMRATLATLAESDSAMLNRLMKEETTT